MKRLLLAGCALVALAGPAHAVLAVEDVPALAADQMHHVETIMKWVQQARAMELQYQQLQYQFAAISGGRPMDVIAGFARRELGYSNTSPASMLPDLLSGQGIGSAARTFIDRNSYAAPQGTDIEALEMMRRAAASGNLLGELRASMEAADARRAAIAQMADEAERRPDLQDSATMANRVAAEKAWLDNENAKVAQLVAFSQAQERVDAMRDREKGREDSRLWRESTQGVWSRAWD